MKKTIICCIAFLLILNIFMPNYYCIKKSIGTTTNVDTTNNSLDINYIYNITEVLSNIIFTCYDRGNSEIAKGRAFGTKGEHKAAEILFENMTNLGLFTIKEQLKPRYYGDFITSKVEVLDYQLTINDGEKSEIVDCSPKIMKVDYANIRKLSRLNLNHNYSGLKVKTEHPSPNEDTEDYVILINKQVQDFTFNGTSIIDLIKGKINFPIRKTIENLIEKKKQLLYPNCKVRIVYYTNNDTHDMNYFGSVGYPTFYINRTIGEKIKNNIQNYTVDVFLKQQLNNSVESYNVIGLLNGTDSSKTVIICCLYDSWWCQGTADSAIGMAMVLGIAKYFRDHNIKPKYNIKFIGFSGEEYGCRGSIFYESTHLKEKIVYVIDLNQLGFRQVEPRLRLEITANSRKFLDEIWEIVKQTEYVNRTGNVTDIVKIYSIIGHISDDRIFAVKRPHFLPFRGCKTVCILKNGQWLYHHRDGLDHTAGDTLDFFDWVDVEVTGEIIINIVKHLCNKT